jgi:hypothetical protein
LAFLKLLDGKGAEEGGRNITMVKDITEELGEGKK